MRLDDWVFNAVLLVPPSVVPHVAAESNVRWDPHISKMRDKLAKEKKPLPVYSEVIRVQPHPPGWTEDPDLLRDSS